ncbi:MAG: SWIM zinc finger family protein [Pseudomonadota bacterium]
MTLTLEIVEALAPDQASLKAASKQVSPKKWPLRGINEETGLIWGECQGSGSNPYRVMADIGDQGYKCTCPSRKFPCKHSLALMWMFAESPTDFEAGAVPDWVNDWVGRRRKTSGAPQPGHPGEPKSLSDALAAEPEKQRDPKQEARRKAATEKRTQQTLESVAAGLDELEQWIVDQLRQGLQSFVTSAQDRCRRIAARMVDAKAHALAGRLDELPARLLQLPAAERADAAIAEFGKLVLLARAWKAAPAHSSVHGYVATSPDRAQVLSDLATLRVASRWEVLGEQVSTRRDGLIAQATWLLNLSREDDVPAFALLLDFFPAATGRRASSFVSGQQFEAELAYFPANDPLRALIVERKAEDATGDIANAPWPLLNGADPLASYWPSLKAEPWCLERPIVLPAGRLNQVGQDTWWHASESDAALPVTGTISSIALGVPYGMLAGVWDGRRCHLLCGHSSTWGRIAFHG